MRNLVGKTIRQYQIILKVRETGTRILFKAYDATAQRTVALEIIKLRVIDQPALLEALQAQAQKNATLSHPNIALLVDSGIYEDTLFLVYNFFPTHSMRRLFNMTYAWQDLARELVAITLAMAHAHEKGIHHGALNPLSIVLDETRNPLLFDFGFEQIITSHILSHSPGAWMPNWSSEYCAPEQLSGAGGDQRSDVYAMGMILFEWLTGEIPFRETSALLTLTRRRTSSLKVLKLDKAIPPAIQTLFQKCIAANPNERYQSMQEVSILLARSALDLNITQKMARTPLSILLPRSARRIYLPIFLMGLIVIVSIGLGLGSRSTALFGKYLATETATPTLTLRPTQTATLQPTLTPAPTLTATPTHIPPRAPVINPYPLIQETPLPALDQVIDRNTVKRQITLSLWGIGEVNHLAASPRGDHLAVGSSLGVYVFDPSTLKLQRYIETGAHVSAVDFSSDGNLLAVGDQDGLVRIWNTNTWRESNSFSGHTQGVLGLAFSPDGTRLASVARDESLFVWKINSKDSPATLPVLMVSCVTYSADGKLIITGGNDFKVNVWQASDLKPVRSLTFPSQIVDMANLGTSSLVIGSADRKLTVVDVNSGDRSIALNGAQYAITSVTASRDGTLFAAGDANGALTVWDASGNQISKSPGIMDGAAASSTYGSVHSLSFSADGKQIASAFHDGNLRMFDARTAQLAQQNETLKIMAARLVVSHDSKYVVFQNAGGILQVWDLPASRPLFSFKGEIRGEDPFSLDNRYMAYAVDQSTVKVFNLSTAKDVYTFNGHQNIQTIQFVNNGAQLAVGNDQRIDLWSMSSGQKLKIDRTFPGNGCAAFNDLGGHLIFYVTSYNHIISNTLYTGVFCGFEKLSFMNAFAINEALGWIAYGGGSQLALVNLRTTTKDITSMKNISFKNIVSLALHPRGTILAAAYDDNTIHFWDIASQEELMQLIGHDDRITDLQFTPDGKILLSSARDGTIRLWGVP